MKKKVKVKRKINLKGLILILLILYLCIMAFYYVYKLPVKKIIISGNIYTTESEIINAANINEDSAIFKLKVSKMKKDILNLDYIEDVKISRNILGKITINVKEANILLYDALTNKYVLSNAKEVEVKDDVIGKPTLINFVPEDILKDFVKGLKDIDESVLTMISEIEYAPDVKQNITIDSGRFFLKMNDHNGVYVNIVNIEKLNRYKEAIASVYDQGPGILSLDSSSNNTLFKAYNKQESVEVGE